MKLPLLDHGYVKLVETWGHGEHSEASRGANHETVYEQTDMEVGIIEAARQSTQGSFRGWEPAKCNCGCNPDNAPEFHEASCNKFKNRGDARLLKYLYSHNHNTPFEFAGMVIEVQAPIFVFREWHRHRTQSYNEMSARYEPLPELYYRADLDNLFNRAVTAKEEKNRQASSTVATAIDRRELSEWIDFDNKLEELFETHYRCGLRIGVPKELARKKMPVDHYSRMRASANLRNWLAFCTLRMDPAAQWEIRQYALAVGQLLEATFPRTWKLFLDSRNDAA